MAPQNAQMGKDSVQVADGDHEAFPIDVADTPDSVMKDEAELASRGASTEEATLAVEKESEESRVESIDDVRIEKELVSDEFRIQGSTEADGTAINQPTYDSELSLDSFNVIFPSIIDFILKQRSGDGVDSSRSAFPILTVDSGKLKDVNGLSDRVSQCFEEYQKNRLRSTTPFWIYWLLRSVGGDHRMTVSLSTLIQARLEVALVDFFRSLEVTAPGIGEEKEMDKTAIVYTIVGHGLDVDRTAAAVDQADLKEARLTTELPNGRPHRNTKGGKAKPGEDFHISVRAIPQAALSDIFAVSRKLSSYATTDDIAKVTAVFGKDCGDAGVSVSLLSVLEKLMQCSGEKDIAKCCLEWNGVFESVVTSLWEHATADGFSLDVTTSSIVDHTHLQDVKSPSGAGKKKKKKKNKKVSHGDCFAPVLCILHANSNLAFCIV
jgi:hypothetical protein